MERIANNLRINLSTEKKILCCVTFLNVDIRLIDDLVSHQSIMHNLFWIKSHIIIITHWICCSLWHFSKWQSRDSGRGEEWEHLREREREMYPAAGSNISLSRLLCDVRDVKMSAPHSLKADNYSQECDCAQCVCVQTGTERVTHLPACSNAAVCNH